MTKKSFPALTLKKKYEIGIGVLLVVALIVIINALIPREPEMVLKTAVVTQDTPLYMDPELRSEYSSSLKSGDLINVIYRHNKDVYYILDAATTQPFAEGYLPDDKFSFNFETANQGILGTNTVFTEMDNQKPAGYVVEKGRTPCIIHGFDNDWASISLPGGIDGLWVKKDRIIYDLNYDLLKAENYGHYSIVKDYMEKEYISAYGKYYANNYVRYLTSYDERFDENTGELTAEFILNGMSKNIYKDPDTVAYIKEAKDAIEGDGDRLYYETLYREYNMYRSGNFVLKLTAIAEDGKLSDVKLFSDMGVGANSDWKELENGLKDFIID